MIKRKIHKYLNILHVLIAEVISFHQFHSPFIFVEYLLIIRWLQ